MQSEVHGVAGKVIERTLWHDTVDGRVQLSQAELHKRTEPLVILGEAGMGKSELLKWLADTSGYSRCTARKLINRANPATLLGDDRVLVIDALDEVSSQKDGDGVNLVLQQLGKLNYPRFILSCRVADWRSSTGMEAIREQYDDAPLELHLEPFNDADATTFLSDSLGDDTAAKVVEHFNARGLQGMLGNPQTLELIARVARSGDLPESTGALFERAIEVLRIEHRDAKAEKQLDRETGLGAAGAVFAGLLITGNEAIVRKSATNTADGELQLAEFGSLFDKESIENILGTRLVKAEGSDRFSYTHRRIGEYVGARWLARGANTHRKRQRLLSLFHSNGLVPTSLRGLHAWLAQDPALASAVIAADPMGVIEYGDADNLRAEQGRQLLRSLESLAYDNPRFCSWGPYQARGIAQPELIEDLQRLICATSTPFRLCQIVLEAVKGSNIAPALIGSLQAVVRNQRIAFANRKLAGQILIEVGEEDWSAIVQNLLDQGDESSAELALELADLISYESLTDIQIVDLLVEVSNTDSRTIGALWHGNLRIPDFRLENILDRLRFIANELGSPIDRPSTENLTSITYRLIVRIMKNHSISAEKLWSWLTCFDDIVLYHKEPKQELHLLIAGNNYLRRAIQRLVLLELPGEKTIWDRAWSLSRPSSALQPSNADIIALLEQLDPTDQDDVLWQQLVQLTPHDGDIGADVRLAARPHANCSSSREWLDRLATPEVPTWKIEQEEKRKQYQEKRASSLAENRKHYGENIEAMREGDFSVLYWPAQAYLKRIADVGNDVPAHTRIAQWLGEDVAQAAHKGFEAFLTQANPTPTAQDIVAAMAMNKHYDAGDIYICALAERFRNGTGFDDLSNERLMAGLFELRYRDIESYAEISGVQSALECTVQSRNLWMDAMRRFHEPQLEAGCEHIYGLRTLMKDQTHPELADMLATEWLVRFPDIQIGPETEMVDRLISSEKLDSLCLPAMRRLGITHEVRHRNWEVIRFLLDFEATSSRLDSFTTDPELLWSFRNRTGDQFNSATAVSLDALQLEWIIKTFRPLWPLAERPSGVTSGDSSPWDASSYIVTLIHRLGNNTDEEAAAALNRLLSETSDGYTDSIKIVIAEQARARAEFMYVPPTLKALAAITQDTAPESITDLQALVVEELIIAQRKIRSDDAESWRGFYDDKGVPHAEERCRDHLLGLLRQGDKDLSFDPEAHVAADKEVDIVCSVGAMRIPIEIKGQWHSELWSGADKQLDALYTGDWRAEGRGIYLVLWFGSQDQRNKRLKKPPQGAESPTTADELLAMLNTTSKCAQEGRVKVVVLDAVPDNSLS